MNKNYYCLNLNLENLQINLIMTDKEFTGSFMANTDSWQVYSHAHYNYEFHYIYEGSAILEINNKNYTLEEGKIYLISPSVYHEPLKLSERFGRISISFDFRENKYSGSSIDKYSFYKEAFENTEPVTVIDVQYSYFHKILKCVNDFRNTGKMDTDIYRSLLTLIFDDIATYLNDNGPKNERPLSDLKSDAYSENINRAKQIEDFIFNETKTNVTIEDLANHLHLSVRHTKRFLDEKMNISFKDFIHKYKMNTAKNLLKNYNISAKAVAFEIGYKSYIGFFKAFKAYTGQTPEEYITANRVENPREWK